MRVSFSFAVPLFEPAGCLPCIICTAQWMPSGAWVRPLRAVRWLPSESLIGVLARAGRETRDVRETKRPCIYTSSRGIKAEEI